MNFGVQAAMKHEEHNGGQFLVFWLHSFLLVMKWIVLATLAIPYSLFTVVAVIAFDSLILKHWSLEGGWWIITFSSSLRFIISYGVMGHCQDFSRGFVALILAFLRARQLTRKSSKNVGEKGKIAFKGSLCIL